MRAVVLLAVVVVGVPWSLAAAARARFGGPAPWHGVPEPADWDADRIRSALTDRLTDQTVADIVIRACLLVAWGAVLVLVLSVVAETVHMVRHDGLAMPDVRGLGLSQSAARVIASGLLVVVPMFATPGRAVARDTSLLVPEQRAAVTSDLAARPQNLWVGGVADGGVRGPETVADQRRVDGVRRADLGSPTGGDAVVAVESASAGTYTVRAGDSIYGIAERLAGPDGAADFAEQLLDLNLGRTMVDGQHFSNAAFIDVGWVLQLPGADASGATIARVADDVHVVERSESLWSIADEELGDATRWPEIYEANRGRTFDDGGTLDDADLIRPGWDLDLPDDGLEPGVDFSVDPAVDPGVEVDAAVDVDAATASPVATPADPATVVSSPHVEASGVETSADSVVASEEAPARPTNLWSAPSGAPTAPTGRPAGPDAADVAGAADASDEGEWSESGLLTPGRAAMLSAGALALLAVRRRIRLRRARPRARLPEPVPGAAVTERELRATEPGDRFARVDIAIRAAALPLVERGGRVVAALVDGAGAVELLASGPVDLGAPWEPTGDDARWTVSAATPIELLADDARRVGAPCPALVQLGRADDGRDVYVDLEALEAIEVGGPGHQADAIVNAVAATLAGSVLAEVTTLIGLGVPDDAFLGHRLHVPVRDVQQAFERARVAIGSTADSDRSTFERRAHVTGGETWEPAIVLVGSPAGTVAPPHDRTGLAVVSASPVHGPSSRLAPDGDAWTLLPLGLRLLPVGLTPAEAATLSALIGAAEAELIADDGPILELAAHRPPIDLSFDDDHTLAPPPDVPDVAHSVDGRRPGALPPPSVAGRAARRVGAPAVFVRLLGPVAIEDADGHAAEFERSKACELVAWLATHRDRSTRQAARTALWAQDVRDATFANVVSEARRSLARLVEPPDGDEWIGRTMNASLPLHPLVRTDADLVQEALQIARVQPPDQAIGTLRPAVDLIVGLPFEGTSYLWSDAEGLSSQFVLLATSATAELAAHCLSVGDVDGVFHATGKGLQVLPGHEELIGLRMQAHAHAGDHAGVRDEWDRYERVINADAWSDGEPSTKLVELRRELLNPSG